MKRVEEVHVYVKYLLFFYQLYQLGGLESLFLINSFVYFYDYYAICYMNASSFFESSCALGLGSYITCK